jgi:hypothetical protein
MNKLSLGWRLSQVDTIPYLCWLEYVIDGVSLAELLTVPVQQHYDEIYQNLSTTELQKAQACGDMNERLSTIEPLGNIGVLRMVWDHERRTFPDDLAHPYVVQHREMLLIPQLAQVLHSKRVPLYTCALCGGYDCGTICVRVIRAGDNIEWKEFRQEVNYGWEEKGQWVPGEPDFAKQWAGIGPFTFSYAEYEQCLRCPPPIPEEIMRQLRA